LETSCVWEGGTRALLASEPSQMSNVPRQAGVSGKVNSFAITGDVRTPSSADTVKVAWSRSNFRASGWSEADFLKPIVTVAAPYSNNMPCNNQFKDLAELIGAALEARGCKPHFAFTPVISDGLTQGTRFMRYSLVSRDAICDAIEIMHEGYKADAIITLGGCDKSVGGVVMPLARKDMIGLSLFGGPALPGLAPARRDYSHSLYTHDHSSALCTLTAIACTLTATAPPGQAGLPRG
jgi:dihydroxyacid dehydratase/phosphogluconate dehydratase